MLDISAWQCCFCNFPHNPILDLNAAWLSSPRVRERCANPTDHYNIRGRPRQCIHYRCATCIDLSIDGRMLRYCDGVMPVPGGAMPARWSGHVTVQEPGRPMGRRARAALENAVKRARERARREEEREERDMVTQPLDQSVGEAEGNGGPVVNGHANGNTNGDTDSSSDTAEDDDAEIPSLHLARQSLIVSLHVPLGAFSEQPHGETAQGAQQAQHFQPVSQVVQPPRHAHQLPPRQQTQQPPRHVHQRPPIQHAQQTQQTQAPAPGPETNPYFRGEQFPPAAPEPPGTTGEEREHEREFSPGGRIQFR
ncbi:hypothetical protein DL98DRAFT_623370 [Cadophora sp. DSE1049]|nr:hypothetical protein DL98DRAFT_623370 [Cadophora sp. DSE1049]